MKSSIFGWFDRNKRNREIFGPSFKTKIIIFLMVLLIVCGVVYYYFGDSIFSDGRSDDTEKEAKKDIDAKADKNDDTASEQPAKEAANAAADTAAQQTSEQTQPAEVQPTPGKTICMMKPDKSDTDFDVESLVDMDFDYTDACRKRIADKKQAVKDAKKFLVDADIAYDKALRGIEKAQNNLESALAKVNDEKANLLDTQEECKNNDDAGIINDTVENTTIESN